MATLSTEEASPSTSSIPSPPNLTISPSLSSFQVPAMTHLSTRAQYDGVATGALVFDPKTAKLLLLQRAAHDSMPNRWEVPGGACDDSDASILEGMARELREEAGLTATAVLAQVGGETEFRTRSGKKIYKYSFLTQTEGCEVTLDPQEHQNFLWASEDEARAKRVGDISLIYTTLAQEETIYEAFRVWKERQARG